MSREKPYVLLVTPLSREAKDWLKDNIDNYAYFSSEDLYADTEFKDVLEFRDEHDRTLFALRWAE